MKLAFSRRGRQTLTACLVVALMTATLLGALASSASAVTGTTGPISVTITPTTGLTDGQPVSISATANTGTMSEIRAHICLHGQPPGGITNSSDFGFQGAYCYNGSAPPPGLGAGDFEKFATLANTTSGALSFKAGIGTVTWFNELGDGPFTLQCDSTSQCDLVVQFQSSVAPNTFYFTTPLSYAATNQAPAITSANNTTFTVGTAGSFTVTATGTPTPTLSESGPLPAGVTFNPATGALAGTPAAGTGGTYPITFTAANGVSPDAVQNFTLTVNQAPAITSANATTFTVGTAGSFTVTATGNPTPTLSESGALPAGVTFNPATGALAGTPAAGTAGTYPIVFTAANGVSPDATQNFTLTVNAAAAAPTITSANATTFTVGTAGSFTVTATGTPTPTLSESGPLPAGVTFNPATGALAGTPAAGTGGTYPITFTAANGVSPDAVQNFTLTVNQAPAITSANATTFTVGTAGSFTVTATGNPTPTLSESGALPAGVTFNPATGALAGTPAAGTAGTYPIVFTAANGVSPDATQNFTLTVNAAAAAPTITSANATTFTVGTAGSLTVTATGNPAPTVSESGALPAGVTFNAATKTLSGTPAAGTGGTYPITFTAANGVSPDAVQNFTLTVNQAPAITSPSSTTFTVGTAGSFTVTATGNPAPTVSETGALPAGVTFTPATGVLAGTPAAGTGGTYALTFTATNGVSPNATQNFTLTVNQAPAITSANATTFTEGSAGSFTVAATGFPAPTVSESGALPAGVTFNAATKTLSGTPAAGTAGSYPITFTAANGVSPDAVQNFTLTVATGPTAPAITSANTATFAVGTAGSFTVTATGNPTPTLSETGALPAGVTFNAATGVLSGTPSAGTTGSYPITFTAANGVSPNATQSFILQVVTGTTGPVDVTVSPTSGLVDGQSLLISSSLNGGATLSEIRAHICMHNQPPGGVNNTSDFGFQGNYCTPVAPGAGTSETFQPFAPGTTSGTLDTFKAGIGTVTWFSELGDGPLTLQCDSSNPCDLVMQFQTSQGTKFFTTALTYAPSTAPVITSANNTTFTVGTPGSFTVTRTGNPIPAVSESGALPAGVTFNPATRALAGTPAAGTGGVYPITFTAANGVSPDAVQNFTLTVNQAPAITSANATTFTVGTAGSFTVTATGFPAPTVSESGTLPAGVTFNPATKTLSGTPAAGTAGTYPIVFTAANGVSPNATQNFTLTVNAAAVAPVITSANSATFTEGTAGSFTVTATGNPSPTLSESGPLPAGVTFTPATGVLAGTPAAGTAGSYPITFTAANGVSPDAVQNFTLTVSAAATAPTITSANATTFTVGTAGSFTVTATGNPAPTVSETGTLPAGVTFNAATKTLSGTPAAGTGGTYPITFTATNGVPPDATQNFTLTVNQAPAITSANSATFTVGTAGSFTVTATGNPSPTVSESGPLPAGVTFTPATGVLAGTPAAGTAGSYPITFTAANGVSPDAVQNFTLTVNQAPAITSANATTFTVGTAGSFTVTATGFPAPTVSESGALPAGVTFNSATKTLSGTPAAGTAGSYPIVFTAANGVSPDATQNFTLTVNAAAVAPAITSGNATTFTVGTAGSFTVTTTGNPAPTVSETGTLPAGVTFNAATKTLSGTPAAGSGGVYAITFTAANGVSPDAVQNFTLTVNQAPAITSANATTFTVGTAGSFTVTATGFPAPTVSESGALPAGVTFNSATKTLSGTPAAGTAGSYPIVFTAANGVSPDATQNFTLTVNAAAVAPAITSGNATTFTVGTAGSFTVTTTGNPTPTVSETGTLPAGVTFNAATKTLSGTPAAGTGGTYALTFTATNGVSPNATQNFTLTVNQAPAITSANATTFTVGTAGSFTVTATGFPAPTVSESGALPAGVTFNSATKTLSGTPAAGTAGSYPITFTATNGVSPNATQNFTLVVIASGVQADLSVTKTDGRSSVIAGNAGYEYTIKVKNNGPATATSVSLTDTWPGAFARLDLDETQGSCSPNTGTANFTCNLGSINSGATVTITADYFVPVTTSGSKTNTVTVSSPVSDPNAANNTASDTNTVTVLPPRVDLVIPNARAQGLSNQFVGIIGNYIQPGATVAFSGSGITIHSVTNITQFGLLVKLSVSSTAPLGPRNLTVTNPDGQSVTCTGCFTVTANPTVTSVNPSSGKRGKTITGVVVNGTNFSSNVNASFGSGITVKSLTRNSSTKLTVEIKIDSGASLGARSVVVSNILDGGSGSCSCFTVTS